jgi:hypothetical protein
MNLERTQLDFSYPVVCISKENSKFLSVTVSQKFHFHQIISVYLFVNYLPL